MSYFLKGFAAQFLRPSNVKMHKVNQVYFDVYENVCWLMNNKMLSASLCMKGQIIQTVKQMVHTKKLCSPQSQWDKTKQNETKNLYEYKVMWRRADS